MFSLSIELCQLVFHMGLFEFDDIINNTIGAILGFIISERIPLTNVKKLLVSWVVIIFAAFIVSY